MKTKLKDGKGKMMRHKKKTGLSIVSGITLHGEYKMSSYTLPTLENVRVLLSGHSRTQSEHSHGLTPKTFFLNQIAFPQIETIERFSNQL